MPAADACLALIRQTGDYLCAHHVTFPDGHVTQLAASALVREAAQRLDAAGLAGDVAATKSACRNLILAWRRLLSEKKS